MAIEVPAILDVEASGFGAGSYPVEIGFALPGGERGCVLIRPEADWTHWDEEAQLLHRLSRDRLLEQGRSVAEVAAWLNEQLRGMTLYSDAWAHDISWLGRLFDRANLLPRFRIEALQVLMSEEQLRNWIQAREQVLRELRLDRHRASADAWLIQQTYLRTLQLGCRQSHSEWKLSGYH